MYRKIGRRDEHDLIGELEGLLKSIEALSGEAKHILGPLSEVYGNGDAPPSNALEQLHSHLRSLIECHVTEPGRAIQFARREATEEAVQIWTERGGIVQLGQTYREKGGNRTNPNAMTRFLASCLVALDSDLNDDGLAAAAVHSALSR
ncbi:MAG: hypothetical protein IOC56_08845 [Methylobacterium sp.]|nr:hypothetical protein [Methylobacterium sp.]MCA3608386.1 hypothetical protein [Methylobacterium sp.]MCA3617877.1 hypothetical protein [Methylobacterium sp.]MCA3621182.1 hypothetical protein [Methylobacterium sp.]